MRIWRVPLLIAAVAAGLWAQSAEKPLTNEDVEAMLASGLPESTILMKIQIAASQGMVDFSTSPGALVALKVAGATEKVLNAVEWAEPFSGAWRAAVAAGQILQAENQAVPGLPEPAGVYFKGASGWDGLSSFTFWAPLYADTAWMHGAREYSVPVPAGQGEVRIPDAQPTFYLRQPTTGARWRIVTVSSHHDRRWLRLDRTGDWDQAESAPAIPEPGVQVTHLVGGIFEVRPTAALTPGDYELCTSVAGGPGLNLCYAFATGR